MKLRDKALERRLRRRVRAAAGQSTSIWKDYKFRHRWWRRAWHMPWPVTQLLWLLIPGFGALLAGGTPEFFVASLPAWTVGSMLAGAYALWQGLAASPRLVTMNHLPLSDVQVFDAQWRRFLQNFFGVAFALSLVYGLIGPRQSMLDAVVFGLVFGFLHAAFLVGLILLVVVSGALQYSRGRWPLFLIIILACAGFVTFGGLSPALCQRMFAVSFWVPPGGMILELVGIHYPGSWLQWVPILMAVSIMVLGPVAFRRVREGYVLSNERFPGVSPGIDPSLVGAAEQLAETNDRAAQLIRSGHLADGMNWRQTGLVERATAYFLNDRQRLVAELLTAGAPRWTPSTTALNFVGALLLLGCWLLQRDSFALFYLYYWMAIVSAPCPGLNAVGPIFPKAPFYAHYPAAFRDLFGVVFLATLTQRLVWLALAFVACGVAIKLHLISVSRAMPFLLKFVLFTLLSCPIAAIIAFSKFDFMFRGFWKNAVLVLFFLAVLAGFLGLFFAPGWQLGLCAAGCTAAVVAAATALYWRWQVRSGIDLIFPTPGRRRS